MLNKEMEKALNEQVQKELYSAYMYLAMSLYLDGENLQGFAHWTKAQAGEEYEHAMKIIDYIQDYNGTPVLMSIEQPPKQWKSAVEVFKQIYAHEKKVTASIHKLMDLALKKKDYPTISFLQWFVDEQVEEEASALEILEKVQCVGDAKAALLMLDNALAKRQ